MITHHLRIPLFTQASMQQLSNSFAAVMADPVATRIPFDAWKNVNQLSISLGSLQLRKTEDIDSAVALLRKLDYSETVRLLARELRDKEAAEQASKRATDRINDEAMPKPSSEEHNLQPKVSLRGLEAPGNRASVRNATALYGRVEGNEKALLHLRDQISQLFVEYQSKQVLTGPKFKTVEFSVMSTHFLQSKSSARKGMKGPVKRFDVHKLCNRYKDIVWAENVPLEKICLSEMAARDFYANGQIVHRAVCRDVASVALPGAPALPLEVRKIGLTYSFARLKNHDPKRRVHRKKRHNPSINWWEQRFNY